MRGLRRWWIGRVELPCCCGPLSIELGLGDDRAARLWVGSLPNLASRDATGFSLV